MGKVYLLLEASDLLVKGLFVSGSIEGHASQAEGLFSGDGLLTAGGAAGYADKKLRAELGTYYQRYKYDYYRDVNEIENVRTVFGSFAYRPIDWLRFKLRYDFERSDRDVHTVTVAVGQTN